MAAKHKISIALLWCLTSIANAQSNEPVDTSSLARNEQAEVDAINQLSSPDGPEIQGRSTGSSELTGIMVDRTITMAGKTFYRAFSQRAMDNVIIGNATITIQERLMLDGAVRYGSWKAAGCTLERSFLQESARLIA